ncbi:MAG: TolB family protein, partial [Anaerolineae bacterium]
QLTAGGDIMLINRDGTGLRRLTGGIDPALSPDGQKVAFTRWDGPTQGTLWVIKVDGSGERAILGETKQIKGPSWSPDSKRIAVNFQEGGRLEVKSECWDLSKGDPPLNYWQAFDITTKVTFNQFGIPTFWICWKLPPDPHWQLRVINVSDGSFEDMPAGQYAFAPAWDPANPWRIVSAAGMGLVWTDVNRGVAEPLTNDPADRAPVFSPDGRYIAVTYHQHDHWEVHRLNAGGSGRVRLTKTPLYAVVDSPRQWNNAAPAFSPAGDEIAFLTDRAGRWEVWVMNVDGSNQRPMFSDAVNDQLPIEYHGNDERSLGWGR